MWGRFVAFDPEGPEEELNLTFNAQPAILATSLLTWQLWQKEFSLAVDAVAGHSLGEYSALCAAESIDFEEAIFLVRKRGAYARSRPRERELWWQF